MTDKLTYFIASYNKASCIPTLELLHSFGITEDIYIVVGDDDPQLEQYWLSSYNLLVFTKSYYYDCVDSIGTYDKTHKVCTYARAFIDEYCRTYGIRYVCFLFDDINSIQLRYLADDGKIHSTKNFDLSRVLLAYMQLLKNDSVYLVGPPSSSYYIGMSADKMRTQATHYGNMFMYDTTKSVGPFKASVLEDMTIVLYNNMIGHMCLCPFGLQVNCREPMATGDCYKGITRSEYVMHHVLLTNGTPMNYEKLSIPYSRFTPKIISGRYRKEAE